MFYWSFHVRFELHLKKITELFRNWAICLPKNPPAILYNKMSCYHSPIVMKNWLSDYF